MSELESSAHSVVEILKERKISITSMESCTSGLIASLITDTEGASSIFKGSFVTYSNEMKINCGVPKEIIDRYGVYSEECAKSMASAAVGKVHADIGIGITGTAGNVDPNNSDSKTGEVYFCILYEGIFHNFHFEEDVTSLSRHHIKELYSRKVFEELLKILSVNFL